MKPFLFLIVSMSFVLSSCERDYSIVNEDSTPHFFSFYLDPHNNTSLSRVYTATFVNDSLITLFCPELERSESIIPSFTGSFKLVEVGGVKQVSGASSHDFNSIVEYVLTGDNGEIKKYQVLLTTYNGIPIIDIETEGEDQVLSKKEFLSCKVSVNNCPLFGKINAKAKIKGRGNYTWTHYPKKPYKIKFDSKQSVFGFPANKDWVLLAEYADRSLLRTAYMCEVSQVLNMEWTPHYKSVDVILNSDYIGTYTLIEQVEKAKNRIDINVDGYIIECDNYYYDEPLFFQSTIITSHPWHSFDDMKYFTFKYPDADDHDIIEGDTNYIYICHFVKEMESSFLLLENDSTSTAYLEYIDVQSFAKWFITTQLTANYDSNYYFVLPSKGKKMKMYPVWDAEWSLGAWSYLWGEKPASLVEDKLAERVLYFQWLIKSPYFITALKKEWKDSRSSIEGLKERIMERYNDLKYSQASNFKRWEYKEDEPYWHATTWEGEVDYVSHFFEDRLRWMDEYMENL